jgi:hypothetical protein
MRIYFLKKNQQRDFINGILSKTSVEEVAKLCNLSTRTIRDWRREKFLIDFKAAKVLSRKTGVKLPSSIRLKDDYWYVSSGSSAGGLAVYKKYGRIGGDPEHRKKKWREWWECEGKHKKHPIIGVAKPIKKPRFSRELAEFVGIVMGDGGITKLQVKITLHYKDDKEYGKFITSLIKKLFDVPVGTCYRKKDSVVHYIISRSKLVSFCVEKLGLKCGNKIKQQFNIPDWIKINKGYAVACLRGLVDTDGSVFEHRYKSNGKWYCYKKISFTSHSKPLRQSVFNIMRDIGLNPRLAGKWDVRLDSIKDVERYFNLVSSHNPKHLNKSINKVK